MPPAYDDNDLEIHLIHEVVLPEPADMEEENPEEPDKEEEDDELMPSISLLAVLTITMFAAIIVQRKQL